MSIGIGIGIGVVMYEWSEIFIRLFILFVVSGWIGFYLCIFLFPEE